MKHLIVSLVLVFVMSCQGDAVVNDAKTPPSSEAVTMPDSSTVSAKDTNVETKTESVKYVQNPVDPKDIVPPLQSIKDLDKLVEGYHVGQNLSADQQQHNIDLKQKIIRGTFDIQELCRLALGKHWDEITAAQRVEFVDMMTLLLETKAIFSKEQLRGDNKLYSVSYNKETYDDAEKKKSTVFTTMNVPKEKLKLEITYKLLLTPYGWKIYDVIVDDASLLANYKFQFDRIIQKNGFADLMERMKGKLEKIKTPKKPTPA